MAKYRGSLASSAKKRIKMETEHHKFLVAVSFIRLVFSNYQKAYSRTVDGNEVSQSSSHQDLLGFPKLILSSFLIAQNRVMSSGSLRAFFTIGITFGSCEKLRILKIIHRISSF
jgi:hypothetical protein